MQNLQQVRHLVTKRPELWAEIKRLEARLGEPWKRGTSYYEEKYLTDRVAKAIMESEGKL